MLSVLDVSVDSNMQFRSTALLFACIVGSASLAFADEFATKDLEFFEKNVRPVLVEHCYECHSAEADAVQAGLRLDRREALLTGGDSGPAIVPGDPENSLMVQSLHYDDLYQMPPDGKLPEPLIADIEDWIQRGAAAPASDSAGSEPESLELEEAQEFWAFQPLKQVSVPPRSSDHRWGQTPIDRFVLGRLDAAGLKPSPPADRYTLIRRASFDLTGLPPSPEQVDAFVNDSSPDAFERLVDRLLASPQYGIRWGRHWLDLARYADTNGADENYVYHHAWRYRDYVVRAFNQDKPYDRFVTEQLAGDLLPSPADSQAADDQLTATGFLVLGPKMLAEQDKEKLVVDLVDEQIDTVGKTFLGLTLGCARCHDHKFDPVPTRDYYAMAGIFLSTRTMDHLEHVSEWLERPLPGNGNRQRLADLKQQIGEKREQRDGFPEDLDDEMNAEKEAIEDEIAELEAQRAEIAMAMAVEEGDVQDAPVHIRGSHLNLAEDPVPRGFLQVVEDTVSAPEIPESQSGRLQLAQWITDPDHPLTARVMVNRIWQHHFGQGLVRTPSDFGLRGSPPTHPQLLDWLASRFIKQGWSIKELHRLIMRSSTYQMASDHGPGAEVDPENRWLWRQNRVRLGAEPIRDSLLAITDGLDLTMGGNLEDTPHDAQYARTTEEPFELPRRAIHLPIVRNRTHEMFAIFDYLDAGVHLEQRPTTTVAHQALFMMNNPWVMSRAETLAEQLLDVDDPDRRLEQAYLRLFARPVRPAEREAARDYLSKIAGDVKSGELPDTELPDTELGDAEARAWTSLCRVLLSLNEFLYVN